MPEDTNSQLTGGGLRSADGFLRWLMVGLCALMPFALYLAFVGSNHSAWQSSLSVLIWTLLISVVATWLTLRTGQPQTMYIVGVIGVLCVEGLWLAAHGISQSGFVFPILVAAVLYRIVRLFHSVSLSEENRGSFLFEGLTSLLVIFLVVATDGYRIPMLGLLLVNVVGRMYAMWGIERLQTQTSGGKHAVVLIIAITVGLLLLGPKIVRYVLLAVGIGGGVLSLPLLYLLNAILPGSMGSRYTQMMQRMATQTKKLNQGMPQSPGTAHHWMWLTLYGVLVIVALVLSWRFIRKTMVRDNTLEQEDAVQIRRTWLHGAGSLRLLNTNDPIRKQYQKFLVERHEQGTTIQPSETVREYEHRVLDTLKNEDDSKRATDIRALYERVRYDKKDDD